MECPHCQTRNPVGAVTCSNCRLSLNRDAATLVGELTPPTGNTGATLDSLPVTPPAGKDDETLDGTAASSMAIPQNWSVPASVRVTPGGSLISLAALTPGVLLGNRYEIIDTLGEGGMGAVYKARDRELDRLVAVKVIRPELAGRPELLQRFKQELILARKITQRNVIRIFDLGEADGIKFITMEYIEGRDLKSLLVQQGKFPPDRAVEIVLQVCLALDAAHAEGVVHRDLKPQNIMIDPQGRAIVMDFGIARSLEFGGMTQTGALIGTPEYMSPEQVRGEHVDARSDLFTLGIIFQELLTGKLPFQAETAMKSMFKRTTERAVSIRQLDPTVPAYLSEICAKCLEIDPNARFQSAREMSNALETWRSGTAAPARLRTLRWMRQGVKSWRWIAAGLSLVLIGVAAFIARSRFILKPATAHAPVKVLVADFTNHTGDPIFDGTLEPMFNVALEGANFVNAFSRGNARKLAQKLPNPTDKLDEQPARLVALSQGINAVITGEISRRGDKYSLSATALDAASGNVIAKTELTAGNKDEVLRTVPKLAAPIRKGLGDTTPESAQLEREGGAFTASSLEVVHQYGVGMEMQFAGKQKEALQAFSKAAEMDPNFARAYAGMTAMAANLGQLQDAEKYVKLAMEHVDRMTDRERYRVRGLYYATAGDWQKCVEDYSQLVALYPADNVGHANLAYCLSYSRKLTRAVEEARRAVEIQQSAMSQVNVALFSAYAGDFQVAEREALKTQQLSPSVERAYLAEAFAQLGQGQMPQAADTYRKLQKLSPLGASMAASGLADLALYAGQFAEAVPIFEQGAAADLAAKSPDAAADKFAALAYTQLWRGQKQLAVAAANKALAASQAVKHRFLAAQIFLQAAGDVEKAQKLAAGLSSELTGEPQAYAKIIEGEIALKRGDASQAVKALTDANSLVDTWLGHFELGRTYLEAKAFAEADSEFDKCFTRRGEAIALFIDEVPTYGYFPPVYYYQGRVREGLHSTGFVESYRNYLSIRGQASEDPLLPEIRKRLGQ